MRIVHKDAEQRLQRAWRVALKAEIAVADRHSLSDRVALAIALTHGYVASMRFVLVVVLAASGAGSVEIIDESNQRSVATFEPSEPADIAAAHLEVLLQAAGGIELESYDRS